MASDCSGQAAESIPRRLFTGLRLTLIVGLLVSLMLCLAFSWNTRDAMAHLPFVKPQSDGRGIAVARNAPVDLSPWQTAQALAALAVTAEEAEYAREAERLADHDVDQAFASALRQAGMQHRSLTGEALALSQRVTQLQQVVKDDQAYFQRLTQLASLPNKGAAPIGLADDLDIAKAQLGLDSDELADAQQDLARAADDKRASIQQELAAHESSMQKYDAQARNPEQIAVVSIRQYDSLARLCKAWFDQRARYQLLQQAAQQAQADASTHAAQHNQLEAQVNTLAAGNGRNATRSGISTSSISGTDKATRLASLTQRAAQRQVLGIYDDRIQTEHQLATVYGKWSAQVLLQHRIVQHLLLQSFAVIAVILICVMLFDALVQHVADRPGLDKRRMQTLRIIFKAAAQVVGILLILFVAFGAPAQMPTIVGLTTAGLTVVLQDFIIAFFGWFVLMGKNGIRVGDWVEINSVGGEVAEIGLFRTGLLETGNWTDKGHPTGRRVTFINSFAIKGQFFNFSTASQWMWDEIMFSIAAAEDLYTTIELVYKAVLKETEQEAQLAQAEWKRVTQKNDLSRFTAEPAVDMRPSASGIDIIVRYITRASNRFEMRNRLYQRVIGLLHQPAHPSTDVL